MSTARKLWSLDGNTFAKRLSEVSLSIAELYRRMPVNRTTFIILMTALVFGVFFAQATIRNVETVGSMDYPPIRGGSDQIDYHIMAFTLASEGFPGKVHNEAMRAPFERFAGSSRDTIRPQDRALLDSYLISRNDRHPYSYAYRPWLYPLLLGASYKVFGYDFSVGRHLNVVLYALTAAVVFALVAQFFSILGGFTSALLFYSVDGLVFRTTQFLTEPSVAFALSMFLVSAVLLGAFPRSRIAAYGLGISLGLCALAKQLFAIVAVLTIISVFVSFLITRSRFSYSVGQMAAICLCFSVVVGPWVAYNVATTEHSSMLTGSSGWHDMPSAYDPRIIEGANRFQIREEIFNTYSEDNNVRIQGDVARSYHGRRIFLENLRSGMYSDDFVRLFTFKIMDELQADWWEWLIRGFAVLGLLLIPLRQSIPLATFIFSSVIFFGLTLSVGGRAFDGFWPLVVALAAIGLSELSNKVWKSVFSPNFLNTLQSRGLRGPQS